MEKHGIVRSQVQVSVILVFSLYSIVISVPDPLGISDYPYLFQNQFYNMSVISLPECSGIGRIVERFIIQEKYPLFEYEIHILRYVIHIPSYLCNNSVRDEHCEASDHSQLLANKGNKRISDTIIMSQGIYNYRNYSL